MMRTVVARFAALVAATFPAVAGATLVVPLGRPPASEGQEAAVPRELAPAIRALEKGDGPEGLRLAREFVKANPRSAPGLDVLGTALIVTGQFAEAEVALTQAVRLEPGRASALVRLGQIALEMRAPKKAEAWLRQALKVSKDLPAAHRLLALALFRQGQVDQALAEAQEALRLSGGKDIEAKYAIAAMYHELGRPAEAEPVLAEVLAARPDAPPQALLLQGLVKLELRKIDEAEALLEAIGDRDPGSEWARLGLAVIERLRGNVPQARAELERLARDRPDWAPAQLELGRTLLAEGKIEAALRAFDRAEQTSAHPSLARIRTAAVLLAMGQVDHAIARAKIALGSSQTAPFARALLARAYLAKGDTAGAERELRAAVTAAPRDVSAPLQLGRFYLGLGRVEDALAQFQEAARRRPQAVEPLLAQVEAYVALKRPTEALDVARQVVKARPDDAGSHVFLGAVHEGLGETEEAAQAYRRALDRERHHLGASRALARLLVRDKRPAEAIRLLEEAAAAHPRSAQPLVDLAVIHDASGDTTRAVAAYREALRLDARSPAVLNNLAYLLGQDPRHLDEALELAERAYRRAPKAPAIVDTFGWLLYQKGDIERAEKLLEQAVSGEPKNPRLRYHLGLAYAKQGKNADARRELEEALRTDAFPEADDARRVLDSLR
jgi:tetratricopeptide (TPR) repeat protein